MKKYNLTKTIKRYASLQHTFRFLLVACLLFSVTTLKAQGAGEETVTGTVTNAATKEPLFGARIQLADQEVAAITNENGEFTLKTTANWGTLIVSAPDYAVREIPLQGKTSVSIELYPANLTSGYETVNTLNGEQRKTMITNPVGFSSGVDLPLGGSLETEIQKQLGGDVRVITRSGIPGAGGVMFIRGLNSLNANAQPLVVVDGVVTDLQPNNTSIHQRFFSNPLTNINMRDVEDISILKDGNSIYGSKAANGVILVSTKRTTDQTTKIIADVSFGMNAKPRLPKMMNATQYRTYASDQVRGYLKYTGNENASQQNILNVFQFMNTDPTTNYYKSYHNDTDWADEIYRNGMVQNYGLSVTGGDDIALYYFSVGYTESEGTIQNTDMNRLNARFNSNIRLSTKLGANVDISISKVSRNLRDDGTDRVTSPGYISLIKAPILSPYRYLISGENAGQLSPKLSAYDMIDPATNRYAKALSNPLAITESALGEASRTVFDMKFNPYMDIAKNLKAETTFNYKMYRVKESFFMPEYGIAPQYMDDGTIARNEVRDLTQRQIGIFSDTRLNWNVDLGADHYLFLTGGYRFMSDTYESDLPKGYNTGNDNVKVLVSGLKYVSITGVNRNWKSMAWYANAVYDYQKRYFLELTASAETSSTYGKKTKDGFELFGQRWGLFPSAAASWVISSEEFMQGLPFVDLLKLRASYGLTGNDDLETFINRAYSAPVTFMGSLIGLELLNVQNDAIQWETTAKMNAGIDMHLFNERFSLSFDVYKSKTDNLLTQTPLRSITGLGYYWSNSGKMENQGYDLSFNVKVLNLKDFTWELGASVGRYVNKITALPAGNFMDQEILGGTLRTEVGRPAGVFYGYKTNGVFATTAEAEASQLHKKDPSGKPMPYKAGDIRFVDKNGDNEINREDRMVIGDPNPDIYGTIFTGFNYKRLSLDAMFTYSYGNDAYNYLRSLLESGSGFDNQTTAMLTRWTNEGQQTSVPKATYGDPQGNNIFSDRWIEDASYLRLKTLKISYEIPIKLRYLQAITLWASGDNLWTLTKYKGSDPEFSMGNSVLTQGVDAGLTPIGRSYNLGVRVNL